MSAPLLRVEGLSKSFGALAVTDDVTFSVNKAGLVALIGPNGAGKTTLINQLSGALQPDEGKISFGGLDICALDMPARAALGLVRSFQIAAVLPEYSALENVALAVQARSGSCFRFFGSAAREERLNAPARAALARVGLLARAGDPAGELVTRNQWAQMTGQPVPRVQRVHLRARVFARVGAADPVGVYAHQHFAGRRARSRDVLDPDVARAVIDRRAHRPRHGARSWRFEDRGLAR